MTTRKQNKYLQQDELGNDTGYYNMTPEEYDAKLAEIAAIHGCNYHAAMDIFHRQYAQAEFYKEQQEAREYSDKRRERDAAPDINARENEIWAVADKVEKKSKIDFQTKINVYEKLLVSDRRGVRAESLANRLNYDALKIIDAVR